MLMLDIHYDLRRMKWLAKAREFIFVYGFAVI